MVANRQEGRQGEQANQAEGRKRAESCLLCGLLRHGRCLRASLFDPFGYTAERREEAALPGEYIAGLEAMLPHLATHAETICQWAEAASGIKGYGPIKARNLAAARATMVALRNAVMMPPKEPHVRAA